MLLKRMTFKLARAAISTGMLAVAATVTATGCQRSESSEYQEYTEVAQSGDEILLNNRSEVSHSSASDSSASHSSTPAADEITPDGNGDPTQEPPDGNGDPNPDPAAGNGRSPNGEPAVDSPTGDVPGTPSGRPDTPTGGDRAVDESPGTDGPRTVKVLVKERRFVAEGAENAWRVSYDDIDLLKVLNMEPVTPDAPSLMPKWLKDLDGTRIRIRGFMYPPFQETGLTGFALARDNQICCFGRDPKIYDVFSVRLKDGFTTDYIQNRPFDVVGVFHIDPIAEDGSLYQLYRVDDAIVIDR